MQMPLPCSNDVRSLKDQEGDEEVYRVNESIAVLQQF